MKIKLKNILMISFLAVAGIFGASAFVVNNQVKETSEVEKAEAAGSLKIYGNKTTKGTNTNLYDLVPWSEGGINYHIGIFYMTSGGQFKVTGTGDNRSDTSYLGFDETRLGGIATGEGYNGMIYPKNNGVWYLAMSDDMFNKYAWDNAVCWEVWEYSQKGMTGDVYIKGKIKGVNQWTSTSYPLSFNNETIGRLERDIELDAGDEVKVYGNFSGERTAGYHSNLSDEYFEDKDGYNHNIGIKVSRHYLFSVGPTLFLYSNGNYIWQSGGDSYITPATNITLNKQLGTGGDDSTYAFDGYAMRQITVPTRTGYTFQGYYDSTSGGTKYYDASGKSANNWSTFGGASTLYARWTHANGRYVTGSFCNWSIDGSVFMTPTATEGEYSGTVDLAYGDTVRTPYWGGGPDFVYNQTYDSYDSLISTAAAYYCFGSSGDNHDMKCYAAGSYTFYFKDSAYSGTQKVSVAYNGSLTAQHLAAKLMNFTENPGHCRDNDRFPSMRTIYLGLSSSEQSTFQGYRSSGTDQFLNAYNRYTAWARALGENPWSNQKLKYAISPLSLFGDNEDDLSTVIIIVSSSIALLSITILSILVIKKRKSKQE